MANEKRMFQKLDSMNLSDIANKTRTVALSNSVVSMKTVKQGGIIEVGVDAQSINDVISGKGIAVLMVIDAEAYENSDKEDVCI